MSNYDYEQLERGLVYAICDEYAIDQGGMKEDLSAWITWLDDEGWTIADKVLRNSPLTEKEKKYSWLATCVCIWRADKCIWRADQGDTLSAEDEMYLDYGETLRKNAVDSLRKGYLDENLTDGDWETLREYRVFLACCILQKGPAWAYEAEIGLYEFGADAAEIPLGTKIKPLSLPTADNFYESPLYSDAPHEDYFDFIKLKALDEFKMMFDAYEANVDKNGRRYAIAKTPSLLDKTTYWTLNNKGAKKPVLLVIASSMDCFWARAGAVFEHIYRAYQHVIDIQWIEIDIIDWLIRGDTTFNHFKPHAGLEEPGHAIHYEDRARLVKKLYMTHPHCTYPALLDDMGDTTANYFHEGGGCGYSVLIDVEGRLAWTSKGESGWGSSFANRPPQRGCCEQFPWVNHVERAILEIIERDGCADTKNFQKTPTPCKPKTVKNVMHLISSRIESIDKKNRILHIIGRPSIFSVIGHSADQKMYFNDPHKMTIHVPEHALISCKNVPVSFDFLTPGDIIEGPGYTWIDELTWEATNIQVSKSQNAAEAIPELFKGTTYLFGKIIDIGSDHITIDPDMNKGRGQNFIQQAGSDLELQAKAKTNWIAHKKWIERGRKPVAVSLIEDTLVYKQGKLADASTCEPGDHICIWYDETDAGKDIIPAAIIISSKQINSTD